MYKYLYCKKRKENDLPGGILDHATKKGPREAAHAVNPPKDHETP